MSRQQDTPHYYMPYDSGDDTGTDDDEDDYDDSSLPDFEDPRIRREEDPRYALIRTAGPNLNTSEQQLKYMEHAPGATYDPSTNITTLQNLVYLNPPKTTVTSLFSVKATNRDRKLFPSPFNFEIKLPRLYKNVTKFQLVQLSFPNNNAEKIVSSAAFLSSLTLLFRIDGVPDVCLPCCISIINGGPISNTMGVAEEGKVNSQGEQILTTLSLSDGTYDNPKIASELTNQANNTPPLNMISFSTFKDYFQTTNDVSILFNEPGDLFFSRLTYGQVHRYFTKEIIMNTYYTQKHINSLGEITDKIAFNAYYYPVLKELVATGFAEAFLTLNEYTDLQRTVIKEFEGLDSDTYYSICSTNKSILDTYRQNYTFELRNVNKYTWSYDEEAGQFKVYHNSLHTSLERDIQKNFDTIFNHQLVLNGLTMKSFNDQKSKLQTNSIILKHLESHLSTKIGEYHLATDYKYFGENIHSTATKIFTVDDLHSDNDFTSMFNFSGIFGNQYGTQPGMKFTFIDFRDYHSTISSYYNLVNSCKSTIASIYSTTYSQHHTYVSTKYSSIFPEKYIENKSYNNNSPVAVQFIGNKYVYAAGMTASGSGLGPECASTFKIGFFGPVQQCSTLCIEIITKEVMSWYSCLPVGQVINTLPYAIGLTDLTLSVFSLYSTIFNVPKGTKNYFLQINNAQSFNNMDVAMNENYDITNETTGQVKLMYAKILTGGLGSGEISQTVIQNPIVFETPLGKLDKLQFKIYYDDDNLTPGWLEIPFEVGFNDWDATFQIDEEIGFADRNTGWGINPTIPIPDNPAGLQYLALTSTNNPNNK